MSRNSEPQAVKDGTVAADLIWLRGVLNWAAKWQGEDGAYLMREDPTRGYRIPKEKNPRRPPATPERVERGRAVGGHGPIPTGVRTARTDCPPRKRA